MHTRNIQLAFFFSIFGLTLVLAFFIFQPYINILILAAIFAIIFHPVYDKLYRKIPRLPSVAAVLVVLLVLLIVFVPLVLLSVQVFSETQDLYTNLNQANQAETTVFGNIPDSSNPYIAKLQEKLRGLVTEKSFDFKGYVQQGFTWVGDHVSNFFQSVASLALALFLWIFAMYYFLRDGHKVRSLLITASPLADSYDDEILGRIVRSVKSVVGGSLIVAIIQGGLTGIGFAVFGISTPFIWGAVGILAALIPTVGTAIITLPAVIYLFGIGSSWPAIGLAVWSIFIIGGIDNILRPKLIERGIRVHPLIILLSVLGGIGLFGPVGFLTGPIIMALLSEFLHVYRQLVLHKEG